LSDQDVGDSVGGSTAPLNEKNVEWGTQVSITIRNGTMNYPTQAKGTLEWGTRP